MSDTNFTPDQAAFVFKRAKGHCEYCGRGLDFNERGNTGSWSAWEVDHIIAKSQGGETDIRNAACACTTCNRQKGASDGVSYSRHFRSRSHKEINERQLVMIWAMTNGRWP